MELSLSVCRGSEHRLPFWWVTVQKKPFACAEVQAKGFGCCASWPVGGMHWKLLLFASKVDVDEQGDVGHGDALVAVKVT